MRTSRSWARANGSKRRSGRSLQPALGAILNAGDVASIRRAPSLSAPAHWFYAGEPGGDFPMHGRVTALAGARQWFEIDGEHDTAYEIDLRVPGAHNRANMAAAIAGAMESGIEPADIVRAIPEIELPRGRV